MHTCIIITGGCGSAGSLSAATVTKQQKRQSHNLLYQKLHSNGTNGAEVSLMPIDYVQPQGFISAKHVDYSVT